MQIVVSNLLTTYSQMGKGRTVVILHGWGDASSGWREFSTELSKRFEVIMPDLPGFGGTQAPPDAWGLDDYAAFVADFLSKMKRQPYAIIGHSNGGAIDVRGLSAGVLQADKLVLLASAGIRNEYKGRNKALRIITKTGKVLTSPLPSTAKQKLRRKVYDTVGSDMLVAEHLQETFKKVVTDDVRTDAANLKQPTLLIYGEQDNQAPVRYGELFHEVMPNSTLEVLPDADHFLHRSHGAKVLELVQEFLA